MTGYNYSTVMHQDSDAMLANGFTLLLVACIPYMLLLCVAMTCKELGIIFCLHFIVALVNNNRTVVIARHRYTLHLKNIHQNITTGYLPVIIATLMNHRTVVSLLHR